jgi:hypothetical protein
MEYIVKHIELFIVMLLLVSCSRQGDQESIPAFIEATNYSITWPAKWTITNTPGSNSNRSSETKTIAMTPTTINTSTITLTRFLYSGRFTLKADRTNEGLLESYFDLDTGMIVNSEEVDIQLYSGCKPICNERLIPINGSLLYFNGQEEPSLDSCISNRSKYNRSGNMDLKYNDHYCVITNRNNYSIVTILSYDVYNNVVVIGFSYKIWR